MSEHRAILFMRSGLDAERQWAMGLEYAERHQYSITGVITTRDDALALARAGAAPVIVAAYADRMDGDRHLRAELDSLGCRLEYVRTPRTAGRPAAAGGLVVGMYVRGGSVRQLAHLLDMDSAAVRQELTAGGIQLRPSDRSAS